MVTSPCADSLLVDFILALSEIDLTLFKQLKLNVFAMYMSLCAWEHELVLNVRSVSDGADVV